ncbi:hypothetical protein BC936DRAFT_148686 [Jimgerdemannia flammicorona]|uniref:ATPase AAA-type core domain-containing protein n=1 Tax=Jimgerdemannia flammicorona TaxID=994334 RepID=A0A433DN25_9FUNG|nr:hypothetical protein BC936DRAFT_148686 [Jimgerdemannia flammicorona]
MLRRARALSSADDGHNVRDTTVNDACYISPLRLTGLFDLWQTCNVLVVCGPPSSGKTVLAYKLIEHIRSQHGEGSVVYVSLSEFVINSRTPNPETVFSNYWRAKAKTTTTWLQHTDANSTVRLIIDDVDVLSGLDVSYFWRRLHVEPGQHLRILLLSRLDPNQHNSNIFPLQYIHATGMRWLGLTRNEVTALTPRLALVGQRVAKSVDRSVILDAIFNSSGGHPGQLRRMLKHLSDKFRHMLATTDEILCYILSPEFHTHLCVDDIDDELRKHMADDVGVNCLHRFLHSKPTDVLSLASFGRPERQLLWMLTARWLVALWDDDGVQSSMQLTTPLTRLTIAQAISSSTS